MKRITVKLDNLADSLESRGLIKYAAAVDEVSNMLEEAQTSLEMSKREAMGKSPGDASFTKIGELLSKEVHDNPQSAIVKNLHYFYVRDKSSVLSMLKKIEALLRQGVELTESDVEFLDSVQSTLSESF